MNQFNFSFYDAFTDVVLGGSQAAIIDDAKRISESNRQRIAREIGMPATVFINDVGANWVDVQFMSTVMELPMCGHGTICLMTHLLETSQIQLNNDGVTTIELRLSAGSANVSVTQRNDNRFLIMLNIKPPYFTKGPEKGRWIKDTLGLNNDQLVPGLPIEVANGDFIHLIIPAKELDTMSSIKPNFNNIVEFCHEHGVETVAVFCTETLDKDNTVHVRDFCPAVGVSESAAAGTTNAALTSYLIRNNIVNANTDGQILVFAEQGYEINRPSLIRSQVELSGDKISLLQVGGVASCFMNGQMHLEEL